MIDRKILFRILRSRSKDLSYKKNCDLIPFFFKLVQFSRVVESNATLPDRVLNSVQEVYRQGGMIDDRRVDTCGPYNATHDSAPPT